MSTNQDEPPEITNDLISDPIPGAVEPDDDRGDMEAKEHGDEAPPPPD